MKTIFIDDKGNYRIGWKIAFAFITATFVSLISTIFSGLIYRNIHINSFSNMINDTMNTNWGHALCSLINIMLLYFVYRILAKHKNNFWNHMGFSSYKPVAMSLIGFLSGMIFCTVYIIPLFIAGQLEIEFISLTPNTIITLLTGLIIYAGVSFSEEITFRGYIQHYLSEKNKYLGIFATSAIFAVMHLINSSYSPLSLIYLFLGGVAFSLMRIVTKGIWFSMAFHLAWNWSEITVFGLNSNIPAKRWFFATVTSESIWTGKDGSSGLAVILVLISCITVLIYIRTKYKSHTRV